MGSPFEAFFNLGNKVTNGDPVRKAKFDYSLFWVLFLAFVYLSINYFYRFYSTGFNSWHNFAWGCVMLVIVWFNYNALSGYYHMYTHLKNTMNSLNNNEKVKSESLDIENNESIDEMLKNFEENNKKEVENGGN
jgi:hypothetical protein